MTKKIPLTQGKFTLVDDIDYVYLSQWKWCVNKGSRTYYAERYNRKGEEGWIDSYHHKMILMHRIVLERKLGRKLEDNELCDHINGNGFDNQRNNLRVVDHRMNAQNLHIEKTSKYPGVHYYKKLQKYQTKIQVEGKQKGLGYFNTQEEAYEKYKDACKIVKSGNKEAIENLMAPTPHSSKYKGVTWAEREQKWVAQIIFNKKHYWFGYFTSEGDAYKKYCEVHDMIKRENEEEIQFLLTPKTYSSKYKNVSWNKASQKWQGYFWFNKKRYHVGYFDDEYEAHLSVEKERSLHTRGNK